MKAIARGTVGALVALAVEMFPGLNLVLSAALILGCAAVLLIGALYRPKEA